MSGIRKLVRAALASLTIFFTLDDDVQAQIYKTVKPAHDISNIPLHADFDFGIFSDAIEDTLGNLWLPGSSGLCVFDGKSLVRYQNGDKEFPLMANGVKQSVGVLSLSHNGRLWCTQGLTKEVHAFNLSTREVEMLVPGTTVMPFGYLRGLYEDDNSYICWFAGRSNGLDVYRLPFFSNKATRIYRLAKNLEKYCYSFFFSHSLWIINGSEIVRINIENGDEKRYTISDSQLYIRNHYISGDDLFLLDRAKTIYKFNEYTDQFDRFSVVPEQLANTDVKFAIYDSVLYIGNNTNFYVVDDRSHTIEDLSPIYQERISTAKTFSNNLTRVLYSNSGNIYAIRNNEIYLLRHNIKESSHRNEISGLSSNTAVSFRGMAEDSEHGIMVSSYSGLYRKRRKDAVLRQVETGTNVAASEPAAYSLSFWKDKLIWNNALINITDNTYRFLAKTQILGHATHLQIKDTLWLYDWNSGNLIFHNLSSQLTTTTDYTPVKRSDGFFAEVADIRPGPIPKTLWLAKSLDGIDLVDYSGKVLLTLSPKVLGLKNDEVPINFIYPAGKNLWFGTNDGLGVLDISCGRVSVYRGWPRLVDERLETRCFYSILPIDSVQLLLGTSAGILRFNMVTRDFQYLPPDQPLAYEEFNRQSAFRASDGRCYFGSTHALYSFLPADLNFSKQKNKITFVRPYALHITDDQGHLSVLGSRQIQQRTQNNDNDLHLDATEENIVLYFSVPHIGHFAHYKYRFITHTSEYWADFSNKGTVQLQNVPTGRHKLEIMVTTDFLNAPLFYSLYIKRENYWYYKPTFISLLTLCFTSLVFWSVRYWYSQKIRSAQNLANLRTKISGDLHDDVGSVLTSISLQSQILARMSDSPIAASLNEIAGLTRDAMERMRDIVWAIDNRRDKFENLLDRMHAFANPTLEAAGFAYNFSSLNIDGKSFLAPNIRQAVFLIFKEAITNVAKHSNGKEVIVNLQYIGGQLTLEVADDGVFYRKDGEVAGSGLTNMHMRADRIGGVLQIDRERGFKVKLTVKY